MGNNTDYRRRKKKLERLAAIEGAKCFNNFYYFFITFWDSMSGEKFIDAPHIKYICDTLQYWGMKVVRRERIMKTVCISVPPGSSKSTIVTIAFNDWLWLHAPNLSTANISYSATLSQQHAYKARAITDSDKWHILFDNIFKLKHGKALQIIKQNQTEMLNNFKGNRFCTSVGGTILGMHADIFAKDDLLSAEGATSDTQRESANRWNDETTTSRKKVPDCYLDIYISQRLHEDDTIGHVLNKNIDITYICLPAEITNASKVSPPEAISLYTDGILDPNRRSREVLNNIKEEMGSAAYTGQYLQAPFNLDEQDIKPSMFEIVESYKDNLVFDLWIDGAYTEKNENDPSGIDVVAKDGNNILVKESYDVRKKLPDLLAFIVELEQRGIFDKEKGRIFIEPKASGHSLADYIEFETDYNFVRIGEHSKHEAKLVQGGKKTRHEIIKPKAESHRIKLLKGTWNDGFITQICGFPRAAHDEHVDNLGYAINHYYFGENTFIEQYALTKLEKNAIDSIMVLLTSQTLQYKMTVSYEENDSGDVQLYDYPYMTHSYRYICVMVPKKEGERGGNTTILVYDRLKSYIAALFSSSSITSKKAAKKALQLANLYSKAKLVFATPNKLGQSMTEEYDFSHIAIAEARKLRYEAIYSRLTFNDIKRKREKEYGFEVNQSTMREVYYNLKEMVESAKVKELPADIFNDIALLERKKETGEVNAKEGHSTNGALAYAIALKVDDEMYDKVILKKKKDW